MLKKPSLSERLINSADIMLRSLASPASASRPSPARDADDNELSKRQSAKSACLMRVNHTGEVCAQALYQGQSLTARNETLRELLMEAADEESDHLAWCQERIGALGGRTSILNPLFYLGSFAVGAAVGIAGDRVNAAFLEETENQVVDHLDRQLELLPEDDSKSKAILEQMREEELQHAKSAASYAPQKLAGPARALMRVASKVMVKTSYFV